MSAIFCSNCGAKHPFTFGPPKFCSSCGQSLGSLSNIPHNKKKRVVDADDEDDEDSSDFEEVPVLSKLEVEIDKGASSKITLGSILLNPPDERPSPLNRSVVPEPKFDNRGE